MRRNWQKSAPEYGGRINNDLVADVWNKEYLSGKYEGEEPLEFARQIRSKLAASDGLSAKRGLYVGCGTGRNYTMLATSDLDIIGLDMSAVGLDKIRSRSPGLAANLVQGDFLDYDGGPFHFLIAIQSFQHGNRRRVERYFEKASSMLESGGLLFLRVNASNTSVLHDHRVVERSDDGFTVFYTDGPKKGTHIRFLSEKGIAFLIRDAGMQLEGGMKNAETERPGRLGSWAQWELVARKE